MPRNTSTRPRPIKPSEAHDHSYAPATPADWHDPDPVSEGEALDVTKAEVETINRVLDGSIVETIDIDVIEDTGAVKLRLEADGGGDLTCRFAGVSHTLDTTPAAEIALTPGASDSAPQINYVYIAESGGLLTFAKSTVGWPAVPHCPVATVFVQTAASLATDGAMKVHAWTDHISNTSENGHLSHINKKLRVQAASWLSGVAPGDLVNGGTDGYLSSALGVIFQLHEHDMPARDMQTGDPIWVVNEPGTPYSRITNLDALTQDASGGTLSNKYMNLVMWGVVSEDAADCKLFLNLPSDTYTVEAQAEADADSTSVYTIPNEFLGTGFLIARYTLRESGGGAWTQSLKTSLLGLLPSTTPGGGAITDHGALFGLTDDDHTQYPLLAGRAGGQTIKGGTAASEDLVLQSGDHATRGDVECVDNLKLDKTVGFDAFVSVSSSSGTLTIDWKNGNWHKTTLTENITTVTFTNAPPHVSLCHLEVTQGAGAYTIAGWPAVVDWVASAGAPVISTGSGDVDDLWLKYRGTRYNGIHLANFG